MGCWTPYLVAALGSRAYPWSSQLRLGHVVQNMEHRPLEGNGVGRHLDCYLRSTAQYLLSIHLWQSAMLVIKDDQRSFTGSTWDDVRSLGLNNP